MGGLDANLASFASTVVASTNCLKVSASARVHTVYGEKQEIQDVLTIT